MSCLSQDWAAISFFRTRNLDRTRPADRTATPNETPAELIEKHSKASSLPSHLSPDNVAFSGGHKSRMASCTGESFAMHHPVVAPAQRSAREKEISPEIDFFLQ
jgi:hypothetical protein